MARRTTTRSRTHDDDEDQEDYEQETVSRRSRGVSRRRNDDDQEEEAPARGRRRSSGSRHDEEEDEPPSRARRPRSHDDDEDDAPRSRRSRSRSREDDDPRRSRSERPARSSAGRGWGGYDDVKRLGGGDWVNHWPFPKKPTLIKFLQAEPFSVYAEHWIDDLPKGTKKSYVCLDEDCPLCDELGDRPTVYALFNILDLANPDSPKVSALRASKMLTNTIRTFAEDKRSKPIDRWDVYFTLHREPEKGARPQLAFVKARDVEEDWNIEPFSEDELDEFQDQLITEDQVVFINTRSQINEVIDLID